MAATEGMSDWKQEVRDSKRDALKAAGVILGLLATCILAIWLLTRSLHKKPPTPVTTPAPAPAGNPPPAP
jgi:hypothetical protein